MSLEAGEQIANMMVLDPYPGFESEHFSMPCRNVLPKPRQTPHPPMWIACTNRDTIKVAARNRLRALAFSFIDPDAAKAWVDVFYDVVESEECVPLGHSVNANVALVAGFAVHGRGGSGSPRREDRLLRLPVMRCTHDVVPGRTDLWGKFQPGGARRHHAHVAAAEAAGDDYEAASVRPTTLAVTSVISPTSASTRSSSSSKPVATDTKTSAPHSSCSQQRSSRVRVGRGRAAAAQSRRTGAVHRGRTGTQAVDAADRRRGHSHRVGLDQEPPNQRTHLNEPNRRTSRNGSAPARTPPDRDLRSAILIWPDAAWRPPTAAQC